MCHDRECEGRKEREREREREEGSEGGEREGERAYIYLLIHIHRHNDIGRYWRSDCASTPQNQWGGLFSATARGNSIPTRRGQTWLRWGIVFIVELLAAERERRSVEARENARAGTQPQPDKRERKGEREGGKKRARVSEPSGPSVCALNQAPKHLCVILRPGNGAESQTGEIPISS